MLSKCLLSGYFASQIEVLETFGKSKNQGNDRSNKEYPTMANLITQKPKQEEKVAAPRGALAPYSDFPFFLSRMRDEFEQMFDRFCGYWPSLWGGADKGWRWGLDIRDEENAVVVQAEAPGFEAGDFDIQMNDNQLVLRAAKKVETKGEKGETRLYREQECYQSVTLPRGLDANKVEAKYHNGVLTVRLPKTAEGKGRRVPVQSA